MPTDVLVTGSEATDVLFAASGTDVLFAPTPGTDVMFVEFDYTFGTTGYGFGLGPFGQGSFGGNA